LPLGRLFGSLLLLASCQRCDAPSTAWPPTVWIIDDGERVCSACPPRPAMSGQDNPIWSPGQPVRLIGLPGEVLAFQVGISAADAPLTGVTVEVDAPFAAVERFVQHELPLSRRSGGRTAGESLGWQRGAMPEEPASSVPDPLIPVAAAPPRSPAFPASDYPMTAPPRRHRLVFVDLTLRGDLPRGAQQGTIRVKAGAQGLAEVPLVVEIGPTPLPYAAVRAMVYYEPEEITRRTGSAEAVRAYLQLLHRHHLGTIYRLDSPADVEAQREELSGQLFTPARGYEGPGQGQGTGVFSLGTYGSLGLPTPERVAQVERTLLALRALSLPGWPRGVDLLLYARDEECDHPAGPAWRRALAALQLPEARALKVAHTCSRDPAAQEVDLPIVFAGAYDAARAAAAGKPVWIYNGQLPQTGAFLTDGGFLSLRVNPWIQAQAGIPRWFYWESTFWFDNNRGGHGPYDPLGTAETFHNQHGDHANGDGVLVYPWPWPQPRPGQGAGQAVILPSLRLKQWRRGISDAGYLLLARRRDPAAAEAVARDLIPAALAKARPGRPPSWPTGPGAAAAFFQARRRLFDLLSRP
jgi:hypothetical protein